jgi:beta-glucosidase
MEKTIYRDLAQPVEARVRDLLARMTLQEKAGQMTTFFVGGLDGRWAASQGRK